MWAAYTINETTANNFLTELLTWLNFESDDPSPGYYLFNDTLRGENEELERILLACQIPYSHNYETERGPDERRYINAKGEASEITDEISPYPEVSSKDVYDAMKTNNTAFFDSIEQLVLKHDRFKEEGTKTVISISDAFISAVESESLSYHEEKQLMRWFTVNIDLTAVLRDDTDYGQRLLAGISAEESVFHTLNEAYDSELNAVLNTILTALTESPTPMDPEQVARVTALAKKPSPLSHRPAMS